MLTIPPAKTAEYVTSYNVVQTPREIVRGRDETIALVVSDEIVEQPLEYEHEASRVESDQRNLPT